jgi:methyltransferase
LTAGQWIVLAVAAQRLAEIALARRNMKRLLAQGGHEVGAAHYPLLVVLHVGWLVALFLAAVPATRISWPIVGLFLVLQGLRVWTVSSLGRFWTTRIVALPDAPLVRRGPYRWLRHPNYAIVAAELAVLPLAFGLWKIALVVSALNLPLLAWRIRVENTALVGRPGGV